MRAKRRDRTNAAFVDAADRLGLTAKPQTSGRAPGHLTRAKVPKNPDTNPSLQGLIGSYGVSVVNYGVSGEKSTSYHTRCVVETQEAMLPAEVSVRLRLAGPFGENLNPIAWFMERFMRPFVSGFIRRPRLRGSPTGLLASSWVQLDEIPETGFLDGYMVAGRFRWPKEAGPPPYGQPEAVMTPARTLAARKLLEGNDIQPGTFPHRSVEIDSSKLESTSTELTTSQDLVDLIEASCDLADAMLN